MAGPREDASDPEVSAIRVVLTALEPLNADARERVIGFVFHRLGILGTGATGGGTGRSRLDLSVPTTPVGRASELRSGDIRSLRDQKKPRSAIEMAVLVAYYLENLAPPGERKLEFSEPDLVRYFKQAAFPLPRSSHMTLVHTKNAGYIDPAGRGLYRLNPVGHNLVAHGLPRQGEPEAPRKPRKRTRKTKARR